MVSGDVWKIGRMEGGEWEEASVRLGIMFLILPTAFLPPISEQQRKVGMDFSCLIMMVC